MSTTADPFALQVRVSSPQATAAEPARFPTVTCRSICTTCATCNLTRCTCTCTAMCTPGCPF